MNSRALAVLIDGENISPIYAEEILQRTRSLGPVSVRLVFGDFRRKNTPPWKSPIVEALGYNLVPVTRQYVGSNSADEAICAKARRFAHRGSADAICIVSCDGGFSTVAKELIDGGTPCYGMGTDQASKRLVCSCTQFFLIGEQLPPSPVLRRQRLRMLRVAVAEHADKQGWAKLKAVDRYLKRHSSLYCQDRWGYQSISKLFWAAEQFELRIFPNNEERVRPTN